MSGRLLRWCIILPLIHLCACAAVLHAKVYAAWLYIAFIDFPVGLAALVLAHFGERQVWLGGYWRFLSLAVFGTLWWFALGTQADSRLGQFRGINTAGRRSTPGCGLRAHPLLFHLLPFLHLCICLSSAVVGKEAAYNVLFLVDFPLSWVIMMLFAFTMDPFFPLCVLGTMWWYLVSREIRGVYRAVCV